VTVDEAPAPVPRRVPRERLLAVDWGDRRIGLALSDELGMFATPLGVITRRIGKRPPIAELMRRAEAAGARGVVFGLPLDGEGEDTPRAREVRTVGAEFSRRSGLPVRYVDERYTTAAALRTIREMGGSTRGRKGDVDALAAAVLLQHALALPDTGGADQPDGTLPPALSEHDGAPS
jgi:putative Holliday junction resolvase